MKNKILKKIIFLMVFLIIIFFLFFKLGIIPNGLFCDEAEIGNISFKLIKNGEISYFINPFFYNHFNYILPSLPIITTAPFVYFGLDDLTVRLPSVFYSLLSIFFIFLTLKYLLKSNKLEILFTLFLLVFTPLFFHISRINFGHAPSFLFISISIFLFFKYKKTKKFFYLITSGISLGISSYGYPGYMIGSLVIFLSLFLNEIIQNKFRFYKYKEIIILFFVFFIFYLPILYQLKFNPLFLKRLEDKNNGKINIKKKVKIFIKNYPKYFSYDYLFSKGEIDLPGDFITRHSIRGNGIYLKIYLFFLILGFFQIFFIKDNKKEFFRPFFILFLLSPIPDLITTKDNLPPYSFSIFYSLINVPYITVYSIKIFRHIKQKLLKKTLYFFLFIVLFFQIYQFINNYYRYPMYSSDYWGWQYGPREIIKYFVNQKNNYDEFYMTGYFNEPFALLSFYNFDNKCLNCFVGGIDKLDYRKKQLFALRKEEMADLKINYLIKKVIYLPNKDVAFYIIEPKIN